MYDDKPQDASKEVIALEEENNIQHSGPTKN